MCAFIGKPACTVASTDRDHSCLRRRWSALACRLRRVRAFWAGERRLPSVFFMAKNRPTYARARGRCCVNCLSICRTKQKHGGPVRLPEHSTVTLLNQHIAPSRGTYTTHRRRCLYVWQCFCRCKVQNLTVRCELSTGHPLLLISILLFPEKNIVSTQWLRRCLGEQSRV